MFWKALSLRAHPKNMECLSIQLHGWAKWTRRREEVWRSCTRDNVEADEIFCIESGCSLVASGGHRVKEWSGLISDKKQQEFKLRTLRMYSWGFFLWWKRRFLWYYYSFNSVHIVNPIVLHYVLRGHIRCRCFTNSVSHYISFIFPPPPLYYDDNTVIFIITSLFTLSSL